MTDTIEKTFAGLADPKCAGLCFAITRKAFAEECGNREENIPRPVYPHALIKDRITDNYIVLRLANEGDDWRSHLVPTMTHAINSWVEVPR